MKHFLGERLFQCSLNETNFQIGIYGSLESSIQYHGSKHGKKYWLCNNRNAAFVLERMFWLRSEKFLIGFGRKIINFYLFWIHFESLTLSRIFEPPKFGSKHFSSTFLFVPEAITASLLLSPYCLRPCFASDSWKAGNSKIVIRNHI